MHIYVLLTSHARTLIKSKMTVLFLLRSEYNSYLRKLRAQSNSEKGQGICLACGWLGIDTQHPYGMPSLQEWPLSTGPWVTPEDSQMWPPNKVKQTKQKNKANKLNHYRNKGKFNDYVNYFCVWRMIAKTFIIFIENSRLMPFRL